MKLLLLGTTGYHPNERRHTACFALPELGVVFDAGTGMFRLGRHLTTDTLDIYLTHAHLDHVIGLTYLFDVLAGRKIEVTVHGEADKLAAIERHLLAPELFPVSLPCRYQALAGPQTLRDGSRLTYFALPHPGGTVGYRIDWPDRSLAYVTDTTASADAPYVEQIRGVDLLVHECYFTDAMCELAARTGHSCVSDVARTARAAGVGRLVLVHMSPADPGDDDPIGLTQAQSIFPASELGRDGQVIEF